MKELKKKCVKLCLTFAAVIILGLIPNLKSFAASSITISDSEVTEWGTTATDGSEAHLYRQKIVSDEDTFWILYFVTKSDSSVKATIKKESGNVTFKKLTLPKSKVKKGTSLEYLVKMVSNYNNNNYFLDKKNTYYYAAFKDSSGKAVVHVIIPKMYVDALYDYMKDDAMKSCYSENGIYFPNSSLASMADANDDDVKKVNKTFTTYTGLFKDSGNIAPGYVYTSSTSRKAVKCTTTVSSSCNRGVIASPNRLEGFNEIKISNAYNGISLNLDLKFSMVGTSTDTTEAKCQTEKEIPVKFTAFDGSTLMNSTAMIVRNKNKHTLMHLNTFTFCDKEWKEGYFCYCGYEQMVKHPATNHTYGAGNVLVQPDCVKAGIRIYRCQKCTHEKSETIAPLGHLDDKVFHTIKEPTCTEVGHEYTFCVRCKARMQHRNTPALGHNDDGIFVETLAATCTEKGLLQTHCKRCDVAVSSKEVAPLGHLFDSGKIVRQATTTKDGYKVCTCSRCKTTKNVTIPKLKSQTTTENNTQSTTQQPTTSTTKKDDSEFKDTNKVKQDELKNNLKVTDKKSGGKYRITNVKKKNGKVVGGSVTYVRPNNINCTKMTAPKNIKIAGVKFKVTSISPKAFKGCKNLKSATLESNIVTVGKSAFYGCSKLRTVNIRSKKIKNIGTNSFKGISSKAKIHVPKGKVKSYKKKLQKGGLSKKAEFTN